VFGAGFIDHSDESCFLLVLVIFIATNCWLRTSSAVLCAIGYPCFKGTTQCFAGSRESVQMVAESGAVEGCIPVASLDAAVHTTPLDYITKKVRAGLVFNLGKRDRWCVRVRWFAHYVAFV